HSLGASYQGRPVGSLARLSTLSFHPVKPITTAEGGAIVTDDEALASKMRVLRNHGITTDFRQRELRGTHDYDMTMLGHNFRLSDLQCALGRNQLAKLPSFIEARQKIAEGYDRALQGFRYLRPLKRRDDCAHAYHLYVVRLDLADSGLTREQIYQQLRDEHIGVAVHYKPVYLHSYYREKLGYGAGLCPTAEAAYATILSFPIYPSMSEADQLDVLAAFERVEERIERGSVG
ncbi:MAG: DegT/DnrJ/EryC1/StrS family aminotransferase, partial [Bdellovibrionales bacterium]|nr:DegT/DnrJ/EryC1/StrS family aminotransferase [Bdellovibrionales bacterium]